MNITNALSPNNLRQSLLVGIVRGDTFLIKQAFARLWKDPSNRNYYKWRLPFIVLSYSYHTIRKFGDGVFRGTSLSGKDILDILLEIGSSPRSREAWALANLHNIIIKSKFCAPSREIEGFFDFIRIPVIKSAYDPLLMWYHRNIESPISRNDLLLMQAAIYLLSTRTNTAQVSEITCESNDVLRYIDPDFILTNESIITESLDYPLKCKVYDLYVYFYYEYPDNYYGDSSIIDNLVMYKLSMSANNFKKLKKDKNKIIERLANVVKEISTGALGGMDQQNHPREESDILQETSCDDASEKLREGDECRRERDFSEEPSESGNKESRLRRVLHYKTRSPQGDKE